MIDHNISLSHPMQITLTQKAYQRIREQIFAGDLTPGQQLVTRTLAQDIGVSLAPVREALYRLSSEGLVDHRPGAGTFVRQPDRQDLEELYTLREALESCAAEQAAKFITDAQLDDMEAILHDWLSISNQIESSPNHHATEQQLHRWLDLEELFHTILVDASRNNLLKKTITESHAIYTVFDVQRRNPAILTLDVTQRTCHDRRLLIDAFRNRNSELAHQLMRDQIQKGRKTVLAFLRQQQIQN